MLPCSPVHDGRPPHPLPAMRYMYRCAPLSATRPGFVQRPTVGAELPESRHQTGPHGDLLRRGAGDVQQQDETRWCAAASR
ncbi:hypothetical protein OEIGOIKO_00120 [Streptomyces chrestomyceticus JCM 4735]|uniref:Uncharacterized protein n=1 Tax=Streptomyces chrestomyceticus JCM 4735 TaxID=1306181 RepID=A0A7U9PTQ0_9ACTN|nr:hypothetical protein [Streptomyces chrestomyceticus]GCD32407.1 hypothetical protein OEIGOIKO_00120 [Streptomyces chrestomyceticus JCM 4735]